jgi:hypothetical protein
LPSTLGPIPKLRWVAAVTLERMPDGDPRTQAICVTLWRMVNRRPRLELIAPAASPLEAAAIMAALERFMRDTAPPPTAPAARADPWTRMAILEGVGREDEWPSMWGDPHPWINT